MSVDRGTKESELMHIPRVTSAFRSLGNDGARANAARALTTSAADRTAVDKLVARLASTRSRSA